LEQGLENTGFIINAMGKELYVKHKNAHEKEFKKPEGMIAMLKPYHPPQLNYTIEDLSQIAQISDVAIITIGRNAGEGADRVKEGDFLLTKQETDIIQNTCDAFHKKTKKVIVVLNIGGVIETASWKERPDAILLAWQGGQEGGNSVADILSGAVNPSGKLPMTFAHHLEDYLSTANFPLDGDPISIKDLIFKRSEKPKDKKVKNKDYTNYQEGIYAGYRGFDKEKKDVSYPFGYGLSYTNFEYSNMDATLLNDTITMSLVVKNNGELPGKEVVQIYFTKPNSSIDRPNQELKSFVKTKNLKPQEQQEIRLQIPVSELRYWNESISGWALENGKYMIKAGASSRNIRIEKEIIL
ncbi:MAG: glycoside hydrolase family 3 C-terminal domain-containing protein, partial [Saprospiraceae bacterium]